MTDYYPYGMDMPGRSYTAEAYRYGYQGSEKDNGLAGGTGYTTFFRALDPRLGRWMAPDPKVFPWQSPYCSMDCNPISLVDPWGAASEGGPKTRTNDDGSVDEYSRNGNTGKDEWHQIVPPMSSASTILNSLPNHKPVSDYSYISEPVRYGYSKDFDHYKAEFGYEGTYSQVYQQWQAQYWESWNKAVKQWDEEEKNRRNLEKLEFFLIVYIAEAEVIYVEMALHSVQHVVKGPVRFKAKIKKTLQADNVVNVASSKRQLKLKNEKSLKGRLLMSLKLEK